MPRRPAKPSPESATAQPSLALDAPSEPAGTTPLEATDATVFALLRLFHFRRVLDFQAISICVKNLHPLERFFALGEREVQDLFAEYRHLRGYVDAAQLVNEANRAAAWRYAERQLSAMATAARGQLVLDHHAAFPHIRPVGIPVDWLFCHPRVPTHLPKPVVAVVGSRQSNKAQLSAARDVAEAVGAMAGTVITGLATGADAAAHEAARGTEATIVAVLGSGVSKVYPPEHAHYVKELLGGRGTVLSEVPPDHTANEGAFVLRNRIVAGMADVVVAVSGKYASGTSHTLRFAAAAKVPVVSADPSLGSGISVLVEELGGRQMTPPALAATLSREDF